MISRLLKQSLRHHSVRIGCCSGFWGDSNFAARQLIDYGDVNYLVGDYLSEITMSLLAKMQMKREDLGFAFDFVGQNPIGCARMIQKANPDIKIACILGDNLKGQPGFEECVSANAYLGAKPIVEALKNTDADIIITGRCVDSALILAPLIHEYGWSMEDFDKLSQGSLAGHLLECGVQSTGGNLTDWKDYKDGWAFNGFPIAVCQKDGSFEITKPEMSTGSVTFDSVAEQMVYEIGDPENYLLPDVSCDWSNVKITKIDDNRISVNGAKGSIPPKDLKMSFTKEENFRLTAVTIMMGGEAIQKSQASVNATIKRVETIFQQEFEKKLIYPIGGGWSSTGDYNSRNNDECAMWLAVEHSNKKMLHVLANELASAGTGMAPGFTALVGGRPKPSPVFKLDNRSFVSRDQVDIKMVSSVDDYKTETKIDDTKTELCSEIPRQAIRKAPENIQCPLKGEDLQIKDLAFCRSGDKGNHCNIGVIARKPEYLPFLDSLLTPEFIAKRFNHVFEDKENIVVEKFYLDGIHALNFVLKDSLGGGGIASLRPDPQGKAYEMKELRRVLSIQSHVCSGYAVDTIHTVMKCTHSRYPTFTGPVLSVSDFKSIIHGLTENGLIDNYDYIMTGYMFSAELLKEVAALIKSIKARNPNLIYLCDPVMGDIWPAIAEHHSRGKMYVPSELLPVYQEEILPLADILTPNQCELELLVGKPLKTFEEIKNVLNSEQFSEKIVVLTSDLSLKGNSITGFAKNKSEKSVYKFQVPRLDITFVGSGDLFSASLLAALNHGSEVGQSFVQIIQSSL